MTILRAFAIILVTAALGAGVGAGIGYALAVLTPGYYATMFPAAAARPGFDPVHVGLGLGLSQGLVAGLVVGCVVVLAVAIASRFRAPALTAPDVDWDRVRAERPPSSDVTPA